MISESSNALEYVRSSQKLLSTVESLVKVNRWKRKSFDADSQPIGDRYIENKESEEGQIERERARERNFEMCTRIRRPAGTIQRLL